MIQIRFRYLQLLRQPVRAVYVFSMTESNAVRAKSIPFSSKPFRQELSKRFQRERVCAALLYLSQGTVVHLFHHQNYGYMLELFLGTFYTFHVSIIFLICVFPSSKGQFHCV